MFFREIKVSSSSANIVINWFGRRYGQFPSAGFLFLVHVSRYNDTIIYNNLLVVFKATCRAKCCSNVQILFFRNVENLSVIRILGTIVRGGPVAKWIRRLTTNQEIPGSTPGRIVFFEHGALTVRPKKCEACVRSFVPLWDEIDQLMTLGLILRSKPFELG